MNTAYLTHPQCLEHDTGAHHPESAERLRAIDTHLRRSGLLDRVQCRQAPIAGADALRAVHPQPYLQALERAVPTHGIAYLDPDTTISAGSYLAALHAAGAVEHAVDLLLRGEAVNAFCAVRPPGHHAEPERSMGFCLLGNAAIGAAHALSQGLERVAVVDFDVHHGNGTQAMLGGREDVLVCSVFQHPHYPYADLDGTAANVVLAPLAAGTSSAQFRAAVETRLLPALERFRPQLVVVSAGFDGHRADPLADWQLETDDYAWVTQVICEVAARHADRRVVSTLEGGYALDALARSVAAHLEVLIENGA